MPIKTLCVLGTRPEAIKMAPVIKRLSNDSRFFNQLCVTGQHQAMLHSVLDLFQLTPDFSLHVMQENQTLSQLTASIMLGLQDVLAKDTPDCILVHGDTTTTLTASLAAYYHKVPVVHVEAGLRTHDLYSPWPEEVNRKLTGALSDLHCAPTQRSRLNLLREGVREDSIVVTGNTVIDALFDVLQRFTDDPHLSQPINETFDFLHPDRPLILITGHRRENFGAGFEQICQGLLRIAQQCPEVDLVYPVHLNPCVQKPVKALLQGVSNIFLIEPVEYLSFVYLMQRSYLILTDSGGIQEEAPSLGKPVLVMRQNTERPEAVDAGTVVLVGTSPEKMVYYVEKLLHDKAYYQQMSRANNPYGDGKASNRIIEALVHRYGTSSMSAQHGPSDCTRSDLVFNGVSS